jgi:hypothetical protein
MHNRQYDPSTHFLRSNRSQIGILRRARRAAFENISRRTHPVRLFPEELKSRFKYCQNSNSKQKAQIITILRVTIHKIDVCAYTLLLELVLSWAAPSDSYILYEFELAL